MTEIPSYTPQKLPEGEYIFTISKEPEKRKKESAAGKFISVTFFFKVDDGSGGGARQHRESLLPWDERYGDLLLAIGGERDEKGQVHLSDAVDIVGKKFKAEIKHELDKDDTTKSWARIRNIVVPEAEGKVEEEPEDDDVPF